ncbi:MAG: hypothetical protein ACYS4W_08920 [Planctomycetota bacterium]|jgi:hypothetical protein
MIFWAGILTGGLIAWVAVRIGFYETWTLLFNIIITVYLSIFIGPMLVDVIPGAAGTPYSKVLTMASTAIVSFLILHCISYTFFTGQISISLPSLFNSLGAAFLGFLAGYLVWSFLVLLFCITPLSQHDIAKGLGFGGSSQQSSLSYMSWWCDAVHRVAASEENEITCKQHVSELLASVEKKPIRKLEKPAEPNEPAAVTDNTSSAI